jgi:EAL domain-containing protein (putative c-di-GMP-specific phosphodiesterase class I)
VIESLHKPVTIEGFGPSISLTASIGVAFGRYETPDELLRDARLALDASKAAGKDRYTLFNANMRSVIEGRGVLEVELNAALQSKQLFLLYEPIHDLASQKVVGLETLLRWRHPAQGVLGPDSFMALAEETGLSVPIGRWMLEEAATRAAAWNVAGHRVGVSVPVTANQLARDGFATDVRRALLQSGIEPSLLTLEISESAVMREIEVVASRLQEMKQLGVRIAVDDFGSGYAHHSDLRRLPLDFLVVDRSSLAASDDEDYRSWLLQAILVLGRDLSLTVIAKGIGSQEEMLTLQTMGCTLAQGPFLGEPVPAEAVVERVLEAGLPAGMIAERGQYTP